jgi:hypothetical protein
MKEDLSLIEMSKPSYPLRNCGFISAVPLVVPEAGNQRFFYLKNLTVELSKTEVVETSWTGTLCDHQNPMMQVGSCGWLCFNQKCSVYI